MFLGRRFMMHVERKLTSLVLIQWWSPVELSHDATASFSGGEPFLHKFVNVGTAEAGE